MLKVLEMFGFMGAVAGFWLLTRKVYWTGMILSLVGDSILVVYGVLTQQWWLTMANLLYVSMLILGLWKHRKEDTNAST